MLVFLSISLKESFDTFCVSEEPCSSLSYLQKAGTFPMTQNRALQLLYDLRYLSIILTAKSEETKPSRIKHDSRCDAVLGFRYQQELLGP